MPLSTMKLVQYIFLGAVFVCVAYFLLMPSTHLRVGNLFFGEVPKLYNLKLAQAFFTYSAVPMLGTPPKYANYQLSRTYFIEGKLNTALELANKEIELHPNNYRTYYILGLTAGYLNREIEAIEYFSKFIEHHPFSWAARNDKAWLQFRVGDVEGGLQTLVPLKELNNPWIQNTYGTLLLNINDISGAKAAFKKAESIVSGMTETEWGGAYPGNDPRIYTVGLSAMRTSIANNLELIDSIEENLSTNN